MSKLDELINKLCPNGVPFVPLCECTKLLAGERITKAMMGDDYQYPVMGGGTMPTGKYSIYNFENAIAISRAGSAGYVNWMGCKFWATDVCFVASQIKDGPIIKFVYYYVKSKQHDLQKRIYGGNLPKLEKNYLWKLPIPVPPMEIQREIVRILDNFMELTAELTTELKAELKARKEQYKYYTEKALSNIDGQKYMVGDVFIIKTGKGITKKDASPNEPYPIISGGKEPMGYYKDYNREANTVTISRVGANAGFVMFIDKRFYLNDKCFSVVPLKKYVDLIDNKFVYYYLKRLESEIISLQSEGGVPTINTTKVASLKFILPSIDKQRKVVKSLDAFESFSSDLSQRLSTEIEARQKQYVYYCDKLLTFKELKA